MPARQSVQAKDRQIGFGTLSLGIYTLFAGHEVGAENWALLANLIANCKMCDIDPVTYLTGTLRALLDGHPKSHIDELMPWNFVIASTRAA